MEFCILSFHFLIVSFERQNHIYLFFFVLFLSCLRNHCLIKSYKDLHLIFSFKSFIILALTFMAFIHTELKCVYGVKQALRLLLLNVDIQFSSTISLRRLFLLNCLSNFVENRLTIDA